MHEPEQGLPQAIPYGADVWRRPTCVVGPFPPPLHGSSKNTRLIAEALAQRAEVVRLNIGASGHVRGLAYHATRAVRILAAALRLTGRRVSGRYPLYMTMDGGLGLYYFVALISIVRLLGLRPFLHHRSFAYIDRESWPMRLVVRLIGRRATHVFLCATMRRRFEARYGPQTAVIVSNASHSGVVQDAARSGREPLRLGLISNLSFEKGLGEFLGLVEAANAAGIATEGILAGPAVGREVDAAIRRAAHELGPKLDWRGPVVDEAKARFFSDIDILVFPTRYANEAQPNVLFEALAAGVPCIAIARGCIAADMAGSGSTIIDDAGPQEFIARALETLRGWAQDRATLDDARQRARARFVQLAESSRRELDLLLERIIASADPQSPQRTSDRSDVNREVDALQP